MHLLLLENDQTIQVCKTIKIGSQENDLYPVSTIYWDSPRTVTVDNEIQYCCNNGSLKDPVMSIVQTWLDGWSETTPHLRGEGQPPPDHSFECISEH